MRPRFRAAQAALFGLVAGIAKGNAVEDVFSSAERKFNLRRTASADAQGRRELLTSCRTYSSVLWTGGTTDLHWNDVSNWGVNYLPGDGECNRAVMASNDEAYVVSPTDYMTHEVELEMRVGAKLSVSANLTIGDEIFLRSNAELDQYGQSVVTVGKRLYLAAKYAISDEAKLSVGTNIYCSILGSLTIEGGAAEISVAGSSGVGSEMHGTLKYVLGSSGAGLVTVNENLSINPDYAKLVVNASAYSSGAALIPLIKYNSYTGSFQTQEVIGLSAGLTSEIKIESDGVYLNISGGGVSPPGPVPSPTPSPTMIPSPLPTQCNSPSDCDDGDGCTLDVCLGSRTCDNTGSACGAEEVCSNQQCVSAPTTAEPTPGPTPLVTTDPTPKPSPRPTQCNSSSDCDDGNGCTVDVCLGDSTCENTGNACGADEICSNQQCVAAPMTAHPSPTPTSAPITSSPTSAVPTVSPETSAPVSSSTTVITLGASGVDTVTPEGIQSCPHLETDGLLIDGSAYTAGAGTITLYQCNDVGFDPMKIKLVNFPEGLWFEIENVSNNVNLVVKDLTDYSEYFWGSGYTSDGDYPEQDSQEHFPEFSWDTVPKWINYRKKPGTHFNDTEIEWIANTNQISWYGLVPVDEIIEMATKIKGFNPNYKQILYWNSYSYWGATIDTFNEDWLKYEMVNGVRVHLTDENGNRRFYNHSIPEMREWWKVHAMTMFNENDVIDGVFTDATRSNMGTDHSNMIEELLNDLPAHAIKMGNFLRQRDSYRFGPEGCVTDCVAIAHNGNRWRMPYADGSYLENVHDGPTNQPTGQSLMVSMQLAREALWRGKIIFWNGAPMNCAPPCQVTEQEMNEYIKPTLAEFLIIAEKYCYFNFSVTPVANEPRWMWETSEMAEFKKPLGRPLGPPVKVGNKFTRHFEHVTVMLTVGDDGVNEGTYEWL